MAKERDILLTVLFCGFIGAMAALTAFLPKQEVSVNEKRTLAKFPEFSVQKLFNGKWEKDFETYISDHFPARNFFASTDSYYMLYSGRNGSNGVYKGKDGYIINTPVKCDEEKLNANITAINNFVKNTVIETKIIVVPSTGYIMSEELPKVHTEYNDGEIIDDIKNRAENAEFIDIRDALTENKDKQIYYKTDHHWTSYGAYLAYKKWAESENIEVRSDYDIESTDGFFGTTYSKSALWYEKSDSIETWEYPINVMVTINDGFEDEVYDSMFFKEHLEELDKYPVFLDGNHNFERIVNNDNEDGKKVLVIDKHPNIAGNVYTEDIENIHVHKYGAHIFHTNNKEVWNYVTRFAEFNRFTNSPVANYKGELYSLPFNMYTFNKMWGVVTPEEAAAKIEEQRNEAGITEPHNLEEQAISLVGKDIYEKLIKGYTEKQWGRDCKDLPAFIIKRLPVRLTFDNNYFNALYQGIPVGGYTKMVANMLDGIEVRLDTDYFENKTKLDALADKIVYTGAIDAYFEYQLGALEYRSVRFETEVLDKPNFQGNAAVNYTDRETPWTRIIEHKWFEFGKDDAGNDIPKTVISREYSSEWKVGDEPYYPVNDEKNGALYQEYKKLADKEQKVIFGGRLGEYKYYDMDAVIASALELTEKELD